MSPSQQPRRTGRPRRPSNQWAAHPVLGAAVRLAALLVPVGVAIATAVLLARVLPTPVDLLARLAWWVAVLGSSTVALLLTDRLARRLLPLAILLELSLVFPDRAPSRLRAARTVSVREMEQRLSRLRSAGVKSRPMEAAETLVTLVSILGLHDSRTRGHSERVRALTDLLSTELDLPEEDRIRLRWAALVHDLGKLTVPAEVLNGGRDLTDDQWAGLRRHPEEGVRLVAGLLPWLGEWGRAVGEHHERWDGTGYPKGLAGDDIGYAARIVAVADSFETMTAARSYSKAMSADAAREELTRCAGSQFDPAVVRAFLGVSVGRLRWVLGPVTWLAEVPFVVTADRAGQAVKAGAIGVVVGGMVGFGMLPGPDRGGSPLDALDRTPSYTELRESAAEGDSDSTGPGGGLLAGTATPSPLLASGPSTSVFGLNAVGAETLLGGSGGRATDSRSTPPGGGSGGNGGAGLFGLWDGEPWLPAALASDGTRTGFVGPLAPQGPGIGTSLPDPTGGVADVPAPAPAPDPVLVPAPPAPQPPAPPAPGAGGGNGNGKGNGKGNGNAGGNGGGATPATPAQPGGPGQPASPATPAQPPNRDRDDDDEDDDDHDDVVSHDQAPAAPAGGDKAKKDKEGKHGDKHDGKHPGKDTDHEGGAAWVSLPGGPPPDLTVASLLVVAAVGAGVLARRSVPSGPRPVAAAV